MKFTSWFMTSEPGHCWPLVTAGGTPPNPLMDDLAVGSVEALD